MALENVDVLAVEDAEVTPLVDMSFKCDTDEPLGASGRPQLKKPSGKAASKAFPAPAAPVLDAVPDPDAEQDIIDEVLGLLDDHDDDSNKFGDVQEHDDALAEADLAKAGEAFADPGFGDDQADVVIGVAGVTDLMDVAIAKELHAAGAFEVQKSQSVAAASNLKAVLIQIVDKCCDGLRLLSHVAMFRGS